MKQKDVWWGVAIVVCYAVISAVVGYINAKRFGEAYYMLAENKCQLDLRTAKTAEGMFRVADYAREQKANPKTIEELEDSGSELLNLVSYQSIEEIQNSYYCTARAEHDHRIRSDNFSRDVAPRVQTPYQD